MTLPTIPISGAGIAGPSLALWLANNGYRVIVVEIAPGIPPGGQTVDLRGAGGDVVERMGLMPQMRAHALEQHGVAWVRSDGTRRAEMPVTAFDGNGLVWRSFAATLSTSSTRPPRIPSNTASTQGSRR